MGFLWDSENRGLEETERTEEGEVCESSVDGGDLDKGSEDKARVFESIKKTCVRNNLMRSYERRGWRFPSLGICKM